MNQNTLQREYAGLNETFMIIWRRNKDREILTLLSAVLEAGELELCKDISHETVRYWERAASTDFEARRHLMRDMSDLAQWAVAEAFLRGHVAFTVDEVNPARVLLTGRGAYAYKPPRC
jgi:hypothetical protein